MDSVAGNATPGAPLRVLIAGGGVAGLEALLALRNLAGGRVAVTLLAPDSEFCYRPLSVGEPFALPETRCYEMTELARDGRAELYPGALTHVDVERHLACTDDGEELAYDVLLLAVGARPRRALPNALTFTGPRDAASFAALLAELDAGRIRRLAFVMPDGPSWPMPLYELALMTALRASESAFGGPEITFITPEEAPLAVFGSKASEAMAELLGEAEIALELGTHVDEVPDGSLLLSPGGRHLEADRVVALPRLFGPSVPGLARDSEGFLPTDAHGRVLGAADVYAAGDGTSFPVKQGGIAAQLADVAAEAIAARAGAPIHPMPFRPVLRGMLLTGGAPRYLRAAAAGSADSPGLAEHCLWWPPSKIAGHYLAPYLARRDQRLAAAVEERRESSVPVELELERTSDGGVRRRAIIAFAERGPRPAGLLSLD